MRVYENISSRYYKYLNENIEVAVAQFLIL